MSARRRKHDPAFKAKVALASSFARGSYGAPTGCALRGPSASDLRVGEDTGQAAPRVFSDHLGPSDELSERKLAELYEQLGRVMVERDFLLRKSGM